MMTLLPHEIESRFGSFKAAWRLSGEGYITRETVVGSEWYVFWMFLGDRWEYLPFGTVEAEASRYRWDPLVGDIELVATAIGNPKKLWLVVERGEEEHGERAWWWMIYWRFGSRVFLLASRKTNGPFVVVV
jgi:hypothetical protein